MTDKITHKGGCHCGTVRFEVKAPADITASRCNCSMCSKTGFLHVFAGPDEFTITEGADNLSEYRFNTGVARHLFCKTCGVKAFYVPRSHPEGWSINANCIDRDTIASLTIEEFDGANWEANVAKLRAEHPV